MEGESIWKKAIPAILAYAIIPAESPDMWVEAFQDQLTPANVAIDWKLMSEFSHCHLENKNYADEPSSNCQSIESWANFKPLSLRVACYVTISNLYSYYEALR